MRELCLNERNKHGGGKVRKLAILTKRTFWVTPNAIYQFLMYRGFNIGTNNIRSYIGSERDVSSKKGKKATIQNSAEWNKFIVTSFFSICPLHIWHVLGIKKEVVVLKNFTGNLQILLLTQFFQWLESLMQHLMHGFTLQVFENCE